MSLPRLIINFCIYAIIEIESELYGSSAKSKESLAILKKVEVFELITNAMTTYMNDVYVSLIKKNDSYFIEKMENICKVCDHSTLCILHFIHVVLKSMFTHMHLFRPMLNTKTYDTYMKDVKKCLHAVQDTFFNKLSQDELSSHQCETIDISKCDPNNLPFGTGS